MMHSVFLHQPSQPLHPSPLHPSQTSDVVRINDNCRSIAEKLEFLKTKIPNFVPHTAVAQTWLEQFEKTIKECSGQNQDPSYFTYLPHFLLDDDQIWYFQNRNQFTDWSVFKSKFVKHFWSVRWKAWSEAFTSTYIQGSLFDFVSNKIACLKKLFPEKDDSFVIQVVLSSIPSETAFLFHDCLDLSIDLFAKAVNAYSKELDAQAVNPASTNQSSPQQHLGDSIVEEIRKQVNVVVKAETDKIISDLNGKINNHFSSYEFHDQVQKIINSQLKK